jgi:hypothetical protein
VKKVKLETFVRSRKSFVQTIQSAKEALSLKKPEKFKVKPCTKVITIDPAQTLDESIY